MAVAMCLNYLLLESVLLLPVAYSVSDMELEPTFDVPMVNVTVKEGATAVLPCSVKYLGEHEVVWTDQLSTLLTFEDRRIIDDERLSIERPYTKDWNLHIRSVRYRDQGIYLCQINTKPVKMKTINLNVLVPSRIIAELSSEDMTVREGETVTLTCNVTGIPMPTVSWYRHKPTKDSLEKESEFCPGTNKIGMAGGILLIHNISRYCGGTYECVAYNDVPPAVNRHIRIAVEFPPEIILPNKRIGQDIEKETILECYISAYPLGSGIWRKNGIDIIESSKYRIEVYQEEEHTITLSLRISALEQRDFGTYTCQASNSVGKDSESMTLYDYSAYRRKTTTTSTTTTTGTTMKRIIWNPGVTMKSPKRPDTERTYVKIVTPRPGQTSQIDSGNPRSPIHSKTVQSRGNVNICSICVVLCGVLTAWLQS